MSIQKSINAVKDNLNETIKETGMKVQSLSFQDPWKMSLSLSVPEVLEALGEALSDSLEKEGIDLLTLSFVWRKNNGWQMGRNNAQVSIGIETQTSGTASTSQSEQLGN